MAEGKLRPNNKGHYIVESTLTGNGSTEPEIKFVTPIAQDIELAKSELKEDIKQREPKSYKRTNRTIYKGGKKQRLVNDVFLK